MPYGTRAIASLSLSINPGVDKGRQPLMFNPALTTCASERMKTQRFSYFAGFAARERMREAKPVKLKKVAFSHFFDILWDASHRVPFIYKYQIKCGAKSYIKWIDMNLKEKRSNFLI